MHAHVCVCAHVRACARAFLNTCAHACVRACTRVRVRAIGFSPRSALNVTSCSRGECTPYRVHLYTRRAYSCTPDGCTAYNGIHEASVHRTVVHDATVHRTVHNVNAHRTVIHRASVQRGVVREASVLEAKAHRMQLYTR